MNVIAVYRLGYNAQLSHRNSSYPGSASLLCRLDMISGSSFLQPSNAADGSFLRSDPAFLQSGFMLMLQKNPETESVCDQQ